MIILGIGGLLGDAAAAVLKDGELSAAVEESIGDDLINDFTFEVGGKCAAEWMKEN